MENKIKEEVKSLWKVLCENASAWDNDDGKMAEANEKMPWDILEEVISKVEKEAKESEFQRCLGVLDKDHSKCPLPQTCIGYQNAQSDLENNPPKKT